MRIGILMLVHTAFDRAAQVAQYWAAAGCPVVIHVDEKVPDHAFSRFQSALSEVAQVSFCDRHACEWGMWGIVAATQSAAEQMLSQHDDVTHVYLMSGSCLPLRPVSDLKDYLAARPETDFIESATTADVPWTVGGLSAERFTLRFPFSWKKHRLLFDGYVRWQRRLGLRRRFPIGLKPHMGSQWWCLTRKTLSAVLTDPDRPAIDRYFKRVWIPDESYFQTLVRRHSKEIESRSLTLSKFDHQGRPHIFYEDHLSLLRRSDCFVARKIWPQAEGLYQAFLGARAETADHAQPNPGKIDRVFSHAMERRLRGRAGLYMQSRFPYRQGQTGVTAAPYAVFQGFSDFYEGFEPWLTQVSDRVVHGHLFASDRVEYAGRHSITQGTMSDNVRIRDYDPESFLTNLLWNSRDARHCFQFSPRDEQPIAQLMAYDVNAQISVIAGAWALRLCRSDLDFKLLRKEAARLQKREAAFLSLLRSPWVKARVRIWSMADFIEAPQENLRSCLTDLGVSGTPDLPDQTSLDGFGHFLQDLKNHGMHPYVMGDFPVEGEALSREVSPSLGKPYIVQ
ncbi:Core-2/I-Branching enzyme [Epibacterium ulvae]|uniref:Peptide O-xylosyltransferase n=1 Tax=Epibacterium ulvae TaxID=1156985 RepID=A0A1G5R7M4_9RHOB|nr:beta-1,6-N-acetylglucosaminyltransferase [Epibacterium ulvae]SCZ70047.1 Core-2/I-Branching enzyme [Epibacterium ulvae]